MTTATREKWSSRWGFILAAAGSAIGLGNIWRFPYITGEHGGGAFILLYILCIVVIGVPVMLCEIALGRHTQKNPVGCFRLLTPASSRLALICGLGVILCGIIQFVLQAYGWALLLLTLGILIIRRKWVLVGFAGVLTGFLIMCYYSVIGGWSLAYIVKAARGSLNFESVAQAQTVQQTFLQTPWQILSYHFAFSALCTAILYKGVQKGIETACRIMIPLLFILMLLIIMRALTLPGAMAGVHFCFAPDFSKLGTQSFLTAMGQAFFTLSLGMGAMITYGSYLDRNENLFITSGWIIALDTLVAILACLMIFPAVFAMGFKPNEGPGLVFQVIPTIFNQLPAGALWGVIFFVLLTLAALTSGISLQEAVVSYLIDEHGFSRRKGALLSGTAILLLGSLCGLSFLNWERLPLLANILSSSFGTCRESFFDLLDNLTCNWLLPLGGLGICLFTGWVWGTQKAALEIRQGSQHQRIPTLTSIWGQLVRYLCPVAILLVFLRTIGWLH